MTGIDPCHVQGSPFWRFSLAFYRKPSVAEACLALQDRAGVDVNVLLFLLWLAHARRRLSPDDVQLVDDRVGAWRSAAVLPLRALRRRLKGHASLGSDGAVEDLRTRIKGIEMEAERLQQEAMYTLSQSTTLGLADDSVSGAASASLAAYEATLRQHFPPEPVAVLLAAMSDRDPAT